MKFLPVTHHLDHQAEKYAGYDAVIALPEISAVLALAVVNG